MAAQSKIEKYNLHSRIVALMNDGKNDTEIATILTQELEGKDTISQPTVSRYTKVLREEVRSTTRHKITEHLKKCVETDLEILDEVQAFHVGEFRHEDNKSPLRSEYGLKAVRVIETKLKHALSDPTTGDDSHHPVDLSEFRNEIDELKADLKKECAGSQDG